MADHRGIIRDYFDCYRTRDRARLRALLAPDFHHLSPFGEWTERDAMLDAIWPSVTGEVYADAIEIFGDGPEYMVRYRHAGSPAHIAEHFRLDGDSIAAVEVYLGVGAVPGADG